MSSLPFPGTLDGAIDDSRSSISSSIPAYEVDEVDWMIVEGSFRLIFASSYHLFFSTRIPHA